MYEFIIFFFSSFLSAYVNSFQKSKLVEDNESIDIV